MPAKPKIKVVTEEIKEENESVEEKNPDLKEPVVQQVTADTDTVDTKLTSFSTLDIEDKTTDTSDKEVDLKISDSKEAPDTNTEDNEKSLPKEQMSSDDVKAWLNDVRPDTSKEMEKSGRSGFKIFMIVILLLIAVGLAAGGFYYYKNSSKESAPNQEGQTTEATPATETPTPEPTAATKVDLTKYSVNILNGSGVTGEAKKVSDILVEKGFKDTKTGNASKTDYSKTEVALKKDVPDEVFKAVTDSLGKTYDVTKVEEPLKETSSYDIVITVGTKK